MPAGMRCGCDAARDRACYGVTSLFLGNDRLSEDDLTTMLNRHLRERPGAAGLLRLGHYGRQTPLPLVGPCKSLMRRASL
jgi:hypothetical protein